MCNGMRADCWFIGFLSYFKLFFSSVHLNLFPISFAIVACCFVLCVRRISVVCCMCVCVCSDGWMCVRACLYSNVTPTSQRMNCTREYLLLNEYTHSIRSGPMIPTVQIHAIVHTLTLSHAHTHTHTSIRSHTQSHSRDTKTKRAS